ncbi:hypothetical protein NMY22_g19593 [Coprinellus aureogranulatus]|nr:hypothetical protein NMY22_g19593 [Coprinellus aureogranulatus]
MSVSGVRLGNTFQPNHGTTSFSVTTIPDNGVQSLQYVDPTTGENRTCSSNCPLSTDSSVPFQDFLFSGPQAITGVQIKLNGFTGASAGLHYLQLLSSGAFASSVEENNGRSCFAPNPSNSTRTGSWNVKVANTQIAGTVQTVLTSTVDVGTPSSSGPSFTWVPYVSAAGNYDINLLVPGCTNFQDCARRTSVKVVVFPGEGLPPNVMTISQRNTEDATALIYSGPILPSSPDFVTTVTMTLADDPEGSGQGGRYDIVADRVQLVLRSANIDGPYSVQEAVFNNVEGNYYDHRHINVSNVHSVNYIGLGDPLKRLERRVSRGAAHNSAERGPDAPRCAEETREAVQADILTWIGYGDNDDPPSDILWLSGPAGSGKTAIASSIADTCHERGWLAGSFFLSSLALASPDRRSKNYIIPTLAFHLIQHSVIEGLKEEVLKAVEMNLSVFDSGLQEQLKILILQPLARLSPDMDRSSWPKVFLIDAVDECDGDQGRKDSDLRMSQDRNYQEIIATLARAAADPSFPFRIIIASRSERAIENAFTSLQGTSTSTPQHVKKIFLDDKYSPQADIELYLRASFVAIGREKGIGDNWFPSDASQVLAKEASGQFIYAAVILRFLKTGAQPPHEQLERVLRWRCSRKPDTQPFGSLDALYEGILMTSPNPSRAVLFLRSIRRLSLPTPYEYAGIDAPSWRAHDSRLLLESYRGETTFLLGSLTSLVGLPENEFGNDKFVFYHKSLLDFLMSQGRSRSLFVSAEAVGHFLKERFHLVLQSTPVLLPKIVCGDTRKATSAGGWGIQRVTPKFD